MSVHFATKVFMSGDFLNTSLKKLRLSWSFVLHAVSMSIAGYD